ncbi:MAG: hypothetical protein PF439_07065 [Helicobacteraceae bacterium]|nr:hypothetical protein [Helicobacteraceae bacterium]
MTGCGSSSSSTPTTAGAYSIDMQGGNGGTNEASLHSGGNGGDLYVDTYLDVSLSTGGSVDASFTVPSYPVSEDLGSNGVTVSSDTNITSVDTGIEPATPGALYLVNGNTNVLCVVPTPASGDTCDSNSTNRVTGLKIAAGATVIVGLNDDQYNGDADNNDSTGQDEADFNLDNDLIVNGTLQMAALTTAGGTVDNRHGAAATDRDKGKLYLSVDGDLIVGKNGLISAAGDDATVDGDRGGDGGDIRIYNNDSLVHISGHINNSGGTGLGTGVGGNAARYSIGTTDSSGQLYLYTYGVTITDSSAVLASNGGSGADGGYAGHLELYSKNAFYNRAALYSNGGNGTGSGGAGNEISLESHSARLMNSGALESNGGSGGTVGGGDAGNIYFYGGFIGNMFNSGTIAANGGSTTDGTGGNGGYVEFYRYGGDIRTTGAITMNGGDSVNGTGGNGDELCFQTYSSYDYDYGGDVRSGDILISGNIKMKGGSGAINGGNGGDLTIYNDDYNENVIPSAGTTVLVNYNTLNMYGGDAAYSGGDGGDAETYTAGASTFGINVEVGSIINQVKIAAYGGDATGVLATSYGGTGGYIDFEAEGEAYYGNSGLNNSGKLIVYGGNGGSGGDSGGVCLYGHDYMKNSAAIDIWGGDASADTGNAGYGLRNDVEFYGTTDIENSGAIHGNGGNATGADAYGENAYSVYMYAGGQTINRATIEANGGTSTGTASNADGGDIDLYSEWTYTSNSGSLQVKAGTGGSGTVGDNGYIHLDHVDVTPADGTL